jgi:microcystin-dependent protein
MADPFVAEIRIFPFNFPPKGWAFCDGQLLPISQNTALFSLLGTFYGGNGQSTFALPDLQGNAAMHQGQGPGLSQRFIGEIGGSETVTLLQSEMPLHAHNFGVTGENGAQGSLTPTALIGASVGGNMYQTTTNASLVQLAPQALAINGAGLPHNNMQPYLALNFCIAMQGVFPPRG